MKRREFITLLGGAAAVAAGGAGAGGGPQLSARFPDPYRTGDAGSGRVLR